VLYKLDSESVDEIISLLKKARDYLVKAVDKLGEASNYSVIDVIFTGPFSLVADALEYSRFSQAKEYVEEADRILRKVRKKIKNAELSIPEIDHTVLWAVLDIGLDGLFIDLVRHYKISQAKYKLEEAIEDIDKLINRLKKMQEEY